MIAANEVGKDFKRCKKAVHDILMFMVDENKVEEKLAIADSVERKYAKALDLLTNTEKTIIKYAFFYDHSFVYIAKVVGRNADALYATTQRIFRKIGKIMIS